MPDTDEDSKLTEPDPLKRERAPLHDPEHDKDDIGEEGEPFPGNFA